jgi:hypothetical protein
MIDTTPAPHAWPWAWQADWPGPAGRAARAGSITRTRDGQAAAQLPVYASTPAPHALPWAWQADGPGLGGRAPRAGSITRTRDGLAAAQLPAYASTPAPLARSRGREGMPGKWAVSGQAPWCQVGVRSKSETGHAIRPVTMRVNRLVSGVSGLVSTHRACARVRAIGATAWPLGSSIWVTTRPDTPDTPMKTTPCLFLDLTQT